MKPGVRRQNLLVSSVNLTLIACQILGTAGKQMEQHLVAGNSRFHYPAGYAFLAPSRNNISFQNLLNKKHNSAQRQKLNLKAAWSIKFWEGLRDLIVTIKERIAAQKSTAIFIANLDELRTNTI